jgi:hypothetical protein
MDEEVSALQKVFAAKNFTTQNLVTLVEFMMNVYSEFGYFFSADPRFILIADLVLQKASFFYKNLLQEGKGIIFDESQ